jgi:glycosyltransferase involved in cell wall biosynthesis
MIDESRRIVARLLDPLLTKPAIRGAAVNLVLTDQEESALAKVATGRMQIRLPNGVPATHGHLPASEREREVLFCARLHPRKRVAAFVEMAAILRARGANARYVVAGPDEGCLSQLQELVGKFSLEDSLSYEGPLLMEDALRRIARAYVYVLPSFQEPFPMSLLEALGAGTPSVCTTGCEISASLTRAGAVLESDGTPTSLADNVQLLLDSDELWVSLSNAGRRIVSEEYSIRGVVDILEHTYYSAVRG